MDSHSNRGSLRHTVLLYVIGIGVVLVWVMLGMAFGPSAALFGVIVAAIALALIVRRYRFGLRTFLLAVAVLGVWLGLKASRDVRMDQALTGIENNGGQLKVYDRQPNFPWGLWPCPPYAYDVSLFFKSTIINQQSSIPDQGAAC